MHVLKCTPDMDIVLDYKTDFPTIFTRYICHSLNPTHNSLFPHNETSCHDGRFETVAKSLEARVQTGVYCIIRNFGRH